MDYRRLCMFGGGIYESIAQIAGVEADTVKDVLEGLASVIVDVTTDSIMSGVSNLDFQVPTIGTFCVRVLENKISDNPQVTIQPSSGLASMIRAVLKNPDVKKKLPIPDMVQNYIASAGSVEARMEAYIKELKARAFARESKQEVERKVIEQAKIDAEKQMLELRRKVLSVLAVDLEMDLNAVRKVVCQKERPNKNDEELFRMAKEARLSIQTVRKALLERIRELEIEEQEGTDWEIQQLRERDTYLNETWHGKGLIKAKEALYRGAKRAARRVVKRRIVYAEGRKPKGGPHVETGREECSGAARGIIVQTPRGEKALKRAAQRVKKKRGRPKKHLQEDQPTQD